jgi:hypothetical protein
MASLDVFKSDAFSTTSLTEFVNKKPYIPTMLRDMGLFEVEPVRTTTIWVEIKNGSITLIPTSKRGEPLFENEKQKRDAVPLQTLRLALGDTITADELQDIRAENSEAELKEVMAEVNDRLTKMAGDMDLTMENLMLGAIQGILVDADGSTVITNFYTEFGVVQPTEIDFDLDNASPASGALWKACQGVVRGMTKAGQGAFLPNTEIVGLCGDNFFDDLIAHPEVQGNNNSWMESQALANEYGAYGAIRYGGITWINYRGTDDGSTVTIGTDKVKFFPRNARGVFKLALAPAEFFNWTNTRGQERYVITVPDRDRNAWERVEVYSYPLPYCTRPEMLYSGRRT